MWKCGCVAYNYVSSYRLSAFCWWLDNYILLIYIALSVGIKSQLKLKFRQMSLSWFVYYVKSSFLNAAWLSITCTSQSGYNLIFGRLLNFAYCYSFIHSKHLYSAPPRYLLPMVLRGTPSPTPVIKSSFQIVVKGIHRVPNYVLEG